MNETSTMKFYGTAPFIGNRCQDREHCQNGNEHADDQDQWSALKYN